MRSAGPSGWTMWAIKAKENVRTGLVLSLEFGQPENMSDRKPVVPVMDKTAQLFADHTVHTGPSLLFAV